MKDYIGTTSTFPDFFPFLVESPLEIPGFVVVVILSISLNLRVE